MTPDQVMASYRRSLDQAIRVRRYTGSGANRPRWDVTVMGQAIGYQPHELIAGSGIQQGDRKVILLAQDLIDRQFPLPLVKGDKLILWGKQEVNVEAIDDSTRRIGNTLIAYEVQARG